MFTVFVFINIEKVFCIYNIKYTVDQVYLYLYLAMYRVFVFVIGILVLVFDPILYLSVCSVLGKHHGYLLKTFLAGKEKWRTPFLGAALHISIPENVGSKWVSGL